MKDTTPEVEALHRALVMARPPEERFLMGIRMFDAARAMVLASLPPGLPPDELRRRLFARLYADLPTEEVPEELRRG
jgi:hypothetical protein